MASKNFNSNELTSEMNNEKRRVMCDTLNNVKLLIIVSRAGNCKIDAPSCYDLQKKKLNILERQRNLI